MGLGVTKLIINADDLGLNKSCTHAILDAFDRKYISSATMCANGAYFQEAAKLCRDKQLEHRIGIHLNLTEGEPLSEGIKKNSMFCGINGMFHGRVNRLKPLGEDGTKCVFDELAAQVEQMRNHGFPITHADSHHHVHTGPFIIPVVVGVLNKYNITKVRIHRNIGEISTVKKLVKSVFNLYLRNRGLITVRQFGGFEDVQFEKNVTFDTSMEMMVHPDYNSSGDLVDKTTTNLIDGGWKLQDEIIALGVQRLYSYLEI